MHSTSSLLGLLVLLESFTAASPTVAKDASRTIQRRAVCTPTAGGSASTDDVPAIKSALSSCGSGGSIVIPSGKTYYINSVLDFAGCKGCTIQIDGTLKVASDLDYWNGRQAIFYMSGIAGATVTGSGLVDGNGQAAYEKFASDSTYKRPTLWYITGSSSDITIKGLRFQNPPNVFHSVTGNSNNVIYSGLTMTAASKSSTAPKNTDGFDVGASTNVQILNTSVTNQDDCVAFKPGCNYVTVDHITCSGSHGLSVGSLGKGAGSTDTVKNVRVTNAIMKTSAKALGIKLYPGGSAHGSPVVTNVTFSGVDVQSSDYAVQIQSCYGETEDYCTSNPSTGSISGVVFENISGTTSSKYDPVVANLNCPPKGSCGIKFTGFTVKAPSGKATVLCDSKVSNAGVTCTSGATG